MSEPPPYRQPGGHRRDDDATQAYPSAPAGGDPRWDDEPSRTQQFRPQEQYRQPEQYRQQEQYRQPERQQEPYRPPTPAELRRRSLDPGALWSGGVVTAVVAALVALAGIIVIRGILKIGILTSLSVGTFGDAKTVYVVVGAFFAAIVATGLLHALLLTTPQPVTFFGWIAGLVTVIIALLPLTTTAPWEQKVATVALDVVIGLVIGLLLTGAARRARRDPRTAPPPLRR